MFDRLSDVVRQAQAVVADFDPELVTSADAARLLGCFDTLARVAAAGRTLAAGRAAGGGAWRDSGHRSAEEWVADKTGTSKADAKGTIEAAKHLAEAPETREAFRKGDISADQASAIASATAADPNSESELLRDARAGATLESTRQASRKIRAAARPDDGMTDQARIHRNRYCSIRSDDDGAVRGSFYLTAEAGAILSAALDAEHDRLFQAARTEERTESAKALHADALVGLARSTGYATSDAKAQPTSTIIVRVDHAAGTRGHTQPGEECSIDGLGPIPVPVAHRLGTDAILAALLVDGERISDLRIAGRTIPARLRLALVARDRACVVPGCDATRHLEIHHLVAFALGGPTSLDNLCRICTWHHDQITYRGATLTYGTHGGWSYLPGMDDPGGGPFDDGHTEPAVADALFA